MSCGVIRKQKYTDSTLLEPTEALKFEAVAITFKMDAKKNEPNKHARKKKPLTKVRSFLVSILSGLLSLLTQQAHMKDLH